MGMPLKDTKKPPTNAPAAKPDTEAKNDAPLPDTPEQGSADDGSGFVPDAPETPNGKYRMRFTRVNTWQKADGTIPINEKTGLPSLPAVTFEITDPKEADKNKRGLPSAFGEEVSFRLDFTSKWYSQTAKLLTDMGVGPGTWPKGKVHPKDNPKGRPSNNQIRAHIDALAGREFVGTVKASGGKGENKDRVFVNFVKIERYTPPARPTAKPIAPPPAEEPAEGSDDVGDDETPF